MVSSRGELFRRGGSDETFGDKKSMISMSAEWRVATTAPDG
jgi:hypothetical protein